MSKDRTFEEVMKAIKANKGLSQSQREDALKRLELGRQQAARFKANQDRVAELRRRKAKSKRGHGDGDVIDTGQFS